MKYKYILFDLDGTLIDTNKLILDSFKHTYKKHLNLEVQDEELYKYFGEPLIVTLRRYSEEHYQEMFNTYIEYNEKHHDNVVNLCENIDKCLQQLCDLGCSLAVVTSKRSKIALRGLELFDIKKYFNTIVAYEDTVQHKPEAEPAQKALELMGAKPEEALMVGDSIFDIKCAQNADVKAVLVKWSAAHGHQEDETEADYIINKVEDLTELVKGCI